MVYRPKEFIDDRPEVLSAFMRAHPFATLVSTGSAGLIASHIPLLHEEEPRPMGRLFGHLARANPQLADLAGGREVLAIFHGPHAYVSPRWYASQPNVPTWNYAVVHAYGRAEATDDAADFRRHMERLAATFEAGSAQPWRMADLPERYLAGRITGIGGFVLTLTRVEGKFKLSQNQPAQNRAGVVAALGEGGDPEGTAVARLMTERERDGQP